ncbi:MAG: hypothetical protein ACOYJ6_20105 [Caulobacterales bacterium]|jgi:hypothetical protein
MNALDITKTDRLFVEEYSRGEITRAQLALRLGRDVTVYDAFGLLDALSLPTPRRSGRNVAAMIEILNRQPKDAHGPG